MSDKQIEVTPEMIEAGVAVLWQSGAVEHQMDIDRDLVRAIFETMQRVAVAQIDAIFADTER